MERVQPADDDFSLLLPSETRQSQWSGYSDVQVDFGATSPESGDAFRSPNIHQGLAAAKIPFFRYGRSGNPGESPD